MDKKMSKFDFAKEAKKDPREGVVCAPMECDKPENESDETSLDIEVANENLKLSNLFKSLISEALERMAQTKWGDQAFLTWNYFDGEHTVEFWDKKTDDEKRYYRGDDSHQARQAYDTAHKELDKKYGRSTADQKPQRDITDQDIQDMLKYLQSKMDDAAAQDAKREGRQLNPEVRTVLGFEKGKKYARLTATTWNGKGQKSAWGFVDMADGALLKSAGWSAPAKGARGNVKTFRPSHVPSYGPSGLLYAR